MSDLIKKLRETCAVSASSTQKKNVPFLVALHFSFLFFSFFFRESNGGNFSREKKGEEGRRDKKYVMAFMAVRQRGGGKGCPALLGGGFANWTNFGNF